MKAQFILAILLLCLIVVVGGCASQKSSDLFSCRYHAYSHAHVTSAVPGYRGAVIIGVTSEPKVDVVREVNTCMLARGYH